MNSEKKEYLLKLIQKLQEDSASSKEIEFLSNFFVSHQESKDWPFDVKFKNLIKEKIFFDIESKIKSSSNKTQQVIPLYKRRIFQLGVAASLILFIAFNFIFESNDLIIDPTNEPIIVNNNIKVGSDKATLTLEDGTNVTLEKGQNYIANNLKSNGEEIVYNAVLFTKPEIAYNYLTIPRGGEYSLKLSDGTQVWLNSESKLKYPVSFVEGETREVELVYGEAYFDVSPSTNHKDSKFKVFSSTQEVEVLGTEFNIKAYKDEANIYTTLVEGKVSINNGLKKEILKPNEQSTLDIETQKILINLVDTYNEVSWKNGVFKFKRKSLKEIMKVLSRWYDMDVVFNTEDIEDLKFIGTLYKRQSIEEIMLSIKNTKLINNYKINDKTITLN